MAHVLMPRLPLSTRKSDHVPVEELPRTRERQTAAAATKGKGGTGDNSGSRDLVQALQVAFDNNWPVPGSADLRPMRKREEVMDMLFENASNKRLYAAVGIVQRNGQGPSSRCG